ncbi:MAG: hypothetical protein ACP5OP_08900, partial [Leptospirillia bacterium]
IIFIFSRFSVSALPPESASPSETEVIRDLLLPALPHSWPTAGRSFPFSRVDVARLSQASFFASPGPLVQKSILLLLSPAHGISIPSRSRLSSHDFSPLLVRGHQIKRSPDVGKGMPIPRQDRRENAT